MVFVNYLELAGLAGIACAGERSIHLIEYRTLDTRNYGIKCLQVITADNPYGIDDVLLFVKFTVPCLDLNNRRCICRSSTCCGSLLWVPACGGGCSKVL